MHKLNVVILFSLFSTLAQASAPKALDRWTVLMTLVSKEMKILENAKHKGPELKYRMLELHSERLKLLHEKNNKDFMEKSKTANVSKNKESNIRRSPLRGNGHLWRRDPPQAREPARGVRAAMAGSRECAMSTVDHVRHASRTCHHVLEGFNGAAC